MDVVHFRLMAPVTGVLSMATACSSVFGPVLGGLITTHTRETRIGVLREQVEFRRTFRNVDPDEPSDPTRPALPPSRTQLSTLRILNNRHVLIGRECTSLENCNYFVCHQLLQKFMSSIGVLAFAYHTKELGTS